MTTHIPARLRWILAIPALSLIAGVAGAQKSAPCPTSTVILRRMALHFASSADHAPVRAQYQLPTLDSTQVRVLGTQDGTTCAKLNTLVQSSENGVLLSAGMRLAYYQAGTYYYVAAVRSDWADPAPAGTVRMGYGLVWVVDLRGKGSVVVKVLT